MSLQAGASKPDENPTINIQFKIQQMAISGTRALDQFYRNTVATRWCQTHWEIYFPMVDIGLLFSPKYIYTAKFQSEMSKIPIVSQSSRMEVNIFIPQQG